MKFFVTGVGGQLGHDVMNELIARGHVGVGSDIQPQYSGIADGSPVTTAAYRQLDITDAEAVTAVITEVNPDAVIHCAAWTAVDAAEDAENIPKVRAINAGGTQNIANAIKALNALRAGENPSVAHSGDSLRFASVSANSCATGTPRPLTGEPLSHASRASSPIRGASPLRPASQGTSPIRGGSCKMTYISTDYVFSGQGTEPWEPDCKDYAPLNVYGQTKLEGELAVSATLENYFIVRIAWVFGLNGKNFIKTMLNVGKKYDTVRVVNDQIGTPTYTYDLARLLVDMNETEQYGYYHATNEGGYISWYDFTREIFRQAGYDTEVIPVTTEEYGLSKAARPFNSRLEKKKLAECGFAPLPAWQDALERYLKALKENGEIL